MATSKTGSSKKEDLTNGSSTFIHPKSRKCIALVKKMKKDSKKEQAKRDTKLKQSLLAEKLLWFQKHMDPNICPYTVELTGELIDNYIARNDEELEQIKLKRSIGQNRNRQHSGREDAIRITKEREINDYQSCGMEIPNILNTAECNLLKKWKGELKLLPNFKLCKFRKAQVDAVLKKKEKQMHKDNAETESVNNQTNDVPVDVNKENADSMDVE
ncbi:translation machinery-associated protein 16 [Nasonia vitripennis]|uniref:Translation machinery-associated protein 16 homolog n=1 Tax=Nasonia vitripennis TaxID=7425 RepID=A0A7M7H1R1_NASVI|nr:translation machinery-associated protein 16 [Nasonia vitripennis]